MKIKLTELKQNIQDIEIIGAKSDAYFTSIHNDTRQLKPGALYLPIVGEKFDGHNFIPQARDAGATVAICDKSQLEKYKDIDIALIVTDDTQRTIADVIRYFRETHIPSPVVGITGSAGKSTTRALIDSVLKQHKPTHSTDGNYNTLWGNAQVLQQYDPDLHGYIVLEIAMDTLGEIAWQCDGLRPDICAIINIGTVHASNVGGVEGVYKTKTEMAAYAHSSGKPMIYNISDPKTARAYIEYGDQNAITIGEPYVDYQGKELRADYWYKDLKLTEQGTAFTIGGKDIDEAEILLPLFSKAYVYNSLIAVAVARQFEIPLELIQRGLNNAQGVSKRFDIEQINERVTVINDAYNANPQSMKASLDTFEELYATRGDIFTVAALGDMRELGEQTEISHRELNTMIANSNIDKAYFLGEYSEYVPYAQKVESLDDLFNRVMQDYRGLYKDQKLALLLKGSNSLRIWEISDRIKQTKL